MSATAPAAGDSIARFNGDLTREAIEIFLAEVRGRKFTRLIITSAGGEVEAGLALGTWVHAQGLDVEVRNYCLSSCANYVFTAAHHKYIAPGAVVAWHGNYILLEKTGDWRDEIPRRMRKYGETAMQAERHLHSQVMRLAAQERAFFARIGVDARLCYVGKQPPWQVPNYFMLAAGDMARFGVTRVHAPTGYPPSRTTILGQDIRTIQPGED